MSVPTDDQLGIHLSKTPSNFWKGRVDARLAISSVVAGLIVLLGAAARAAVNGDAQFLASILVGVAIFGLVVLYGYLRHRNASVFLRNGNVGVTNWLGLSRSVPVESIDHLHRTAEIWTGEKLPRGVLLIV